jgi:hypothetical protein
MSPRDRCKPKRGRASSGCKWLRKLYNNHWNLGAYLRRPCSGRSGSDNRRADTQANHCSQTHSSALDGSNRRHGNCHQMALQTFNGSVSMTRSQTEANSVDGSIHRVLNDVLRFRILPARRSCPDLFPDCCKVRRVVDRVMCLRFSLAVQVLLDRR